MASDGKAGPGLHPRTYTYECINVFVFQGIGNRDPTRPDILADLPLDLTRNALQEKREMEKWLSGRELVDLYQIRPHWKILDFVIYNEICPIDTYNQSPALPRFAKGRLSETRADIAALNDELRRREAKQNISVDELQSISALKNKIKRFEKNLYAKCIQEWKLFASHCQCHEVSLRECEWLDDDLNADAINSLLKAVYRITYELNSPEVAEGFHDGDLKEKRKLEQEITELEETDPKGDPEKWAIRHDELERRWGRYEELKDELRDLHDLLKWKARDEHSQQSANAISRKVVADEVAKTKDQKPTEWDDPVVKAGLKFLSRKENEEATLEDIACCDEVTRCFESNKMPEVSTIMKRLQGKVPVKKGRRKTK